MAEFMRSTGTAPVVATKFAPLPWRLTADSVVGAARASLGRLQMERMDLYIQHWPGFFTNVGVAGYLFNMKSSAPARVGAARAAAITGPVGGDSTRTRADI